MNMLKSNELNTVTKYRVLRLLQVKWFAITSMAKHFFDQNKLQEELEFLEIDNIVTWF